MIAWLYNKFLLRRATQMVPPQPTTQAPVPPHSHPPAPKPEQDPE